MHEALKAEIAALAARDLSIGADALGPEVLELRTLVSALQAQYLRFLDAFDAAQGYDDEHLSSAGWLQAQTNASAGEAQADRRTAALRRRLPLLAAAHDGGEISQTHLKAVAAGIRDLPPELWPDVDTALATVARLVTAQQLAEVLQEVKQNLQPEPTSQDESHRDQRRLSVSNGFGGMTEVHGRLTPEVGEKLQAALSAASRPDGPDESRLPGQRKADALERVLDEVLDTGKLPADGGEKPHINLTIDWDQLSAGPTAPGRWVAEPERREAVVVAAARAAVDGTSGAPRFAWTGPISVNSALRLSCDGILLPIFTRGGQPLDVGRRHRIVPAPLRSFIAARDKHCRWPGCSVPPSWCHAHHHVHWGHGGDTSKENCLLLCPRHHDAAHDGRWTVIRHDPGIITVRRRRSPSDPYYETDTSPPAEQVA